MTIVMQPRISSRKSRNA